MLLLLLLLCSHTTVDDFLDNVAGLQVLWGGHTDLRKHHHTQTGEAREREREREREQDTLFTRFWFLTSEVVEHAHPIVVCVLLPAPPIPPN